MRASKSVFIHSDYEKDEFNEQENISSCDQKKKLKKQSNYYLLRSRLVMKQIRNIMPSFMEFAFITDTNILEINHTLIINIISILFYIEIIFFSFFFDLREIWSTVDKMNKISKSISEIFHFNFIDNYLYAPSLYIQVAIFLIAIFVYSALLIFKKKKFIISWLIKVLFVISESLTLTFLLYLSAQVPFGFTAYVESNYEHPIFLALAILPILSIPAYCALASRALTDVRLSDLPYISTDPVHSLSVLVGIFISISAEPMLCLELSRNKLSKVLIYFIILFFSLNSLRLNIKCPAFINHLTQILVFSACLLIPLNLTTALVLSFFVGKIYPYLHLIIMLSFNIICPIFSLLFYNKYRQITNDIFSQTSNASCLIPNLTEDQICRLYAFYTPETKDILSSFDLIENIFSQNNLPVKVLVIALRFLYSSKKHSEVVFDHSASLFQSSVYRFFIPIQLGILVELSNELSIDNNMESTVRLQRLDSFLDRCVDSHILFWRAILYDNPMLIGETAFILNKCINSAKNYFRYLNLTTDSHSLYQKRYTEFLTNIAADVSFLNDCAINNEMKTDVSSNSISNLVNGKNNYPKIRSHITLPALPPKITRIESMKSDFDNYLPLVKGANLEISPEKKSFTKNINSFLLKGEKISGFFLISMFLLEFLFFVCATLTWSISLKLFSLAPNPEEFINIEYSVLILCYEIFISSLRNISNYDYNYSYNYFLFQTQENNSSHGLQKLYIETNGKISSTFLNFNKTLVKFAFSSLEMLLNSKFNSLNELATSKQLYECAIFISQLGANMISESFKTGFNIKKKDTEVISYLNKVILYNFILALLILPFLIFFLLYTYSLLNHLFWQPICLSKANVKKIYDYFLSTCFRSAKMKTKVRLAKQGKEFTRLTLIPVFVLIIVNFLILFIVQVMLTFLSIVLVKFFNQKITKISIFLLNSGVSNVPYFSVLFDLLPISTMNNSTAFYPYIITFLQMIGGLSGRKKCDLFTPEYILVKIPDNFSPLISLPFIKLQNLTISYNYISSINALFSILHEIAISINSTGNCDFASLQMLQWLSNGNLYEIFTNLTHKKYIHESRNFKIQMILCIVLIFIVHCVILLISLKSIYSIHHMIRLIVRLMTILPANSPFNNDENRQIKFFDNKPTINLMPILDSIPLAFISVDSKGDIVQMNKMAKDIYGSNMMGEKYYPIMESYNQEGQKSFYKMLYSSVKDFPYHPFYDKLAGVTYYVLQNITPLKQKDSYARVLHHEFQNYKRSLIPIMFQNLMKSPESSFILDKIAIVEVQFNTKIDKDTFFFLKSKLIDTDYLYQNAYIFNIATNSFFAIFSSYNQNSRKRQYCREAMKCAELVYNEISNLEIEKFPKISITHGERCIAKVSDTASRVCVELFNSALMKSAAFMKCANNGNVIVECEIIKNFDKLPIQPMNGSCIFDHKEYSYRIMSDGLRFQSLYE